MIRSFLSKKRTKEDYLAKISSEPEGTRKNRQFSILNFERYVNAAYEGRNTEDIFEELLTIQGQDRENALYDMLQNWINWNHDQKRNNNTIRVMFSNLRNYFYYRGIKTDQQDIKANLKFGKKIENERHPLSDEEYRNIITAFGRMPLRQTLYLCLGSSGMRIGEALNLRKRDLDTKKERIKINIPAEITKTRKGRSTYISNETKQKLLPILDKLNPDDLIFIKPGKNPRNAHIHEQKSFAAVLKRLGLESRYSSNNYRKITSHSFRAYFFTKAARKHGENYAHRLVGHGGYLIQYDRLLEEDKLKMYIELEPDLVIFEQTKNELEINRLRKENQSMDELREEVKKLKENQARQDKETMFNMLTDGILPKIEG